MKFIERVNKTDSRQKELEKKVKYTGIEDGILIQRYGNGVLVQRLHRSQHCGAARYVLNLSGIEEDDYLTYAMKWAKGMAQSAGKDPKNQPPKKCIDCYVEDIKIEDFKCPIKEDVPKMLKSSTSLNLTIHAKNSGIMPEDVGSKRTWFTTKELDPEVYQL